MDPLTVLREFVLGNDLGSVAEVGDRFNFGDRYSFPKVRIALCNHIMKAWGRCSARTGPARLAYLPRQLKLQHWCLRPVR